VTRTGAVTVVVPTRDRQHLLERTLTSVLAQVGVEVRAIVIDEASSDGTASFLRSIRDPRVSVITHSRPRGLAAARNAGLAAADTEWIAFTDDDDLWAPTKLAAQLAALRRDPSCGWSCVGAIWVDGPLRPVAAQRLPSADELLLRLLVVNVIPGGGSGVLVRTDLLRDIGGFTTDPEAAAAADWDCWIRLAERSQLAVVDAPLLAYRVASGSMSRDTARMDRALRRVRSRHAALARTLGVVQDTGPAERYLANVEARSGLRRSPARRLVSVAWRQRRPQPLLYALMILCSPRAALAARSFHARHVTHRRWFAASEAWMATFRVERWSA
jgi:glycosyltransferase involved in cell wall biosynthesis